MMKNMMPNQPSGPASNMAPPPGPRPLFAAGQAQPPPGGPPGSGPVRGAVGQPVGKIVSSSANSRIVHPEDDVSLEELKAKKYKHLADRTGTVQFSMGLSSNNQRDNNKDRENEGYDNGNTFDRNESADRSHKPKGPTKGRLPFKGPSRGGFGSK